MSRVFLTGDTHGSMSISKLASSLFPEGKKLTKDDIIIILGDFGIIWKEYPDKHEVYWKDWLDNKPWTTIIVPGNHDNYSRINSLPQVKKYGAKIKQYSDSIYICNRGEVYTFNNQKFFTMGGALSIDKYQRTIGISWWEEEIPSNKEFECGLSALEKHNKKVDYILGHTAPESVITYYLNSLGLQGYDDKVDTVTKYFETVVNMVEFKRFYFGHMHDDKKMVVNEKEYYLLFDKIVELD